MLSALPCETVPSSGLLLFTRGSKDDSPRILGHPILLPFEVILRKGEKAIRLSRNHVPGQRVLRAPSELEQGCSYLQHARGAPHRIDPAVYQTRWSSWQLDPPGRREIDSSWFPGFDRSNMPISAQCSPLSGPHFLGDPRLSVLLVLARQVPLPSGWLSTRKLEAKTRAF